MKAVLLVHTLFICAACLAAQDGPPKAFGTINKWALHTEAGAESVELSYVVSGGGRILILSLRPEGNAAPTAKEEEVLLRRVFQEMEELHIAPSDVVRINTLLQNSEYQEGVQRAVYESGKWKSCMRQMYCHQAQPVANQFLSSIDAYKAFDQVLHEYDLVRKEVRVDDMSVVAKEGTIRCSAWVNVTLQKEK